jgi:hypothetical protein
MFKVNKTAFESGGYMTKIEDVGLSTRTMNALRRGGVNTLEHLATLSPSHLKSFRNMGIKSVEEVERVLKDSGMVYSPTSGLEELIRRIDPEPNPKPRAKSETDVNKTRSLYQCWYAKVNSFGKTPDKARIYCKKGYDLDVPEGTIPIIMLEKDNPLEFNVCQKCPDYLEQTEPVYSRIKEIR